MYIRNPAEWSLDQLKFAGLPLEILFARGATREDLRSPPVIRRIGIANIRVVLAKGLDDFVAFRDDVVLICVIYPFVGLVLARLAFGGAEVITCHAK
jgi:hypothetical protein